MTDTTNVETVVTDVVKNDAQVVTPSDNTAEIAELRKKAEQAEMRARQLENEKRDREKADEEASQKRLEEQNEYKTLYERERDRLAELEQAREADAKQSAIKTAQSAIFAEYSPEITKLASAVNLGLNDDSEEAKTALKTKLDLLKEQFPQDTKRVQGNNGVTTVPDKKDADTALNLSRMRYNDTRIATEAKSKAISGLAALDVMRKNAGLVE